MKVACNSCNRTLNVPDKLAGKRVKCPACGQPLDIPMLEDSSGIEIIADAPAAPPALPAASPPAPRRGARRPRRGRGTSETEDAMLRTRSYTTSAIVVLVLYFVLWIPGFIANIVYLLEARSVKRRTGKAPDGLGCLWALLIWWFGGGILAVILITGGCLSCAAVGSASLKAAQEQMKRERAAAAALPVSDVTWADLEKMYGRKSDATSLQKSEAWKAYKGKKVKWTGKALRVGNTRGTLKLLIGMNSESSTPDVEVHLNSDQREKALKLKEGDQVTFIGILDRWSGMGTLITLKFGEIVAP